MSEENKPVETMHIDELRIEVRHLRAVHAQFVEQDTDLEMERADLHAENKHLRSLIQALQNGLGTLVDAAQRAYVEPWRTSARDITSHVNIMMTQGIAPYAKKARKQKKVMV